MQVPENKDRGAMTETAPADSRIFADPEALARNVAEWLVARVLASDGRFAICCSGGSTPKRLYEILAEPDVASRLPWRRMHWFWGDERFVPRDHPDSNYRMVRDALLSKVDVPQGNIHGIRTEGLSPEQAAASYEATLKDFYGTRALDPRRPLFQVNLLGIGEDGHTASLFPGHPALEETKHWVVAVVGAKSEARITLTYPVLDSSGDVAFLAQGDGKRSVVARARAGDSSLPAARVQPVGRLHWFTDRAAAGDVNRLP
jgi:6-phosphogluconolactonase